MASNNLNDYDYSTAHSITVGNSFTLSTDALIIVNIGSIPSELTYGGISINSVAVASALVDTSSSYGNRCYYSAKKGNTVRVTGYGDTSKISASYYERA